MRAGLVVALLVVLGLLAGCGGADAEPQPATPKSPAAPIGPGLSVEEALDSDLDGPLLVRGYVIEQDGELRLCASIRESSPPQCGAPSLRVRGDAVASAEPTSLLGTVSRREITLVETSTG